MSSVTVRPGPERPTTAPVGREAGSPGVGAGGDHVGRLVRHQLPFVVLAGVLAVCVKLAAAPLTNYDTYFHLRFGAELLDGEWSLRHPGSVTTYGTADWVPTQWLPQVAMAQVDRWFGLPGVAWLFGALLMTLAVTVYGVARRWSDPLVATLVVILVLVACTTGLSMRPQLISYLLVAVTVGAWLRASQTLRTPWWLVPLTWLWAMCHGMAPVGVLISLVAVAGLALDGSVRGRRLARFAAVPVAAGAVFVVSPVGPGLLRAILLVNSRGHYFTEWDPPDLSSTYGVAVLLLLAVVVVPLTRRGGASWATIGMLVLAAGWAVYSTRTVPVAACVLAPLAASALQQGLGAPRPVARSERLAVAGALVTALALLGALVPHTSSQPVAEPEWLDPTLSALPSGTHVLNTSSLGGYLVWRYPRLDFVMNGYGDLYTDAELERNASIENLAPGWVQQVKDTGVRYALLSARGRLAYALRQQGWTEINGDDELELLQPPAGWSGGPDAAGAAGPA